MPEPVPVPDSVAMPAKPLLLYDVDCALCRRWVSRWQRLTGDSVSYGSYQDEGARFPELAPASLRAAVHLVEPDGQISSGAEAVFRVRARGGLSGALWLYRKLPGFAAVAELGYGLVARHRRTLAPLDHLLARADAASERHVTTRWLFLRLLGLVYLLAFASLWPQLEGLVGPRGVLPVPELFASAREYLGSDAVFRLPSLLWLSPADQMGSALQLVSAAGVVSALLLIVNLLPLLALGVSFVCYLSLVSAGNLFMGFQWDALLLETGFLALFLAPRGLRPGFAQETPPRMLALWLVRWLLFRLYFLSGVVKLTSGDVTWRQLTALDYHYFSQPLPTWLGYYVHQLPVLFGRSATLLMFVIELAVPWLMFGPRRVRHAAALVMLLFQVAIALTGNYGFFNLLSIVLCLALLDDDALRDALRKVLPPRWRPRGGVPAPGSWRPRSTSAGFLTAVFALVVLLVTTAQLIEPLRPRKPLPWPARPLERWTASLRLINSYGLFRVMTTRRPELVLEGSNDGLHWQEYGSRWKPGDLSRAPAFMAPHMPRLDWQLWFAALGAGYRNEGDRWVIALAGRILEGASAPTALLGHDPFAASGRPPRYLRILVYDYAFTDLAEHRTTGRYWSRTLRGLYLPILTLVDGEVAVAENVEPGFDMAAP